MFSLQENHLPYLEQLSRYNIEPMDLGTRVVTIGAGRSDWRSVVMSEFVNERYLFRVTATQGRVAQYWSQARADTQLAAWVDAHSKMQKGKLAKLAKAVDQC
jgi:hypothetical protein